MNPEAPTPQPEAPQTPTPKQALPTQPIAEKERNHFLDALRGFAMLGILPVNIPYMAMAPNAAETIAPGTPDQWAMWGTEFFLTYKCLSTFSFLFGIGLFVMLSRAKARGQGPGLTIRRLSVLWAVGCTHAMLLWFGDILSLYAPLGLVCLWCWVLRPRNLVLLSVVLLCIPMCFLGFIAVMAEVIDPAPVTTNEAGPDWEDDFSSDYDDTSPIPIFWSDAKVIQVFQEGPIAKQIQFRFAFWLVLLSVAGLYFAPRLAGLMLLGMAAAKSGWFDRLTTDAGKRTRWHMIIWGLLTGVPTTLAGCYWYRPTNSDNLSLLSQGELLMYPGSLGLAAAGIAMLASWYAHKPQSRILQPFVAVGRTAFSNYLGQSVITAFLFCSFGLGWFGEFDRMQLLGVCLGIWIIELVLSVAWLKFFRIGPLEWLWRSATYLSWQPLLRKAQ